MNKLKAMTTFVKIVDCGSMSAAAEKLSMSQSSVVRTLAALEEVLGVQLLIRTTRRLNLTEEGREYYRRCRQILHEVEDAENALNQKQSNPTGLLRVTAPVTFGRMHLSPVINEFLEQFPNMEIELILLDRVVDLLEEGIDIALRIGSLPDSTLIAKPVGTLGHIICASPDYIAKAGMPESPTEIINHDCIHLTALNSAPEWPFYDRGSVNKIRIAGKFKTNHVEAARDACCDGLGIGQFLSYQVGPHIAQGKLIAILEDYSLPPLPINLVYPHSRQQSSRSRVFIDWAQPLLKRRIAEGFA
ncbi:MAG: LysR family transcriptional regulator [Neptuniibacter sp.]